MCLIVCSNKGFDKVPVDVFEQAYESNCDGFGIMYCDADEVIVLKGLFDLEEILNLIYSAPTDRPVAMHFRMATHGIPSKKLSHPFETPSGAVLMHNGVLPQQYCIAANQYNLSDTAVYARMHSEPLHISAPWRKAEGERIGCNKLVFLDPIWGNLYIVNQQLGTKKYGCWFSNSNSFYRPKVYNCWNFGKFSAYNCNHVPF